MSCWNDIRGTRSFPGSVPCDWLMWVKDGLGQQKVTRTGTAGPARASRVWACRELRCLRSITTQGRPNLTTRDSPQWGSSLRQLIWHENKGPQPSGHPGPTPASLHDAQGCNGARGQHRPRRRSPGGREAASGSSETAALTARSRSPPTSACAWSWEGAGEGFCWAAGVADASGAEEGAEASPSPPSPGFPSGSRNLPCCL